VLDDLNKYMSFKPVTLFSSNYTGDNIFFFVRAPLFRIAFGWLYTSKGMFFPENNIKEGKRMSE